MSGFILDALSVKSIADTLPDITDLSKRVLEHSPDLVSILDHEGQLPVAAVCMGDVCATLMQARYALFEAFANRIWYLEKCEKPDEMVSIAFAQFYADDAALRLYAAGEHLANAIISMLEITDAQYKQYHNCPVKNQ